MHCKSCATTCLVVSSDLRSIFSARHLASAVCSSFALRNPRAHRAGAVMAKRGAGASGAADSNERPLVARREHSPERPKSRYGLHKLDRRELTMLWGAVTYQASHAGTGIQWNCSVDAVEKHISASYMQQKLHDWLDEYLSRLEDRVIEVQVGRAGETPRTRFEMKVPMSTRIADMKAMIQVKDGIPADHQRITSTVHSAVIPTWHPQFKELIDKHDLAHYMTTRISVEEVGVKIRKMNGDIIFLAISRDTFDETLVLSLKERMKDFCPNTPRLNMRLLFHGNIMTDYTTLGGWGVSSGNELHLVIGNFVPQKASKPGEMIKP